MTIKKFWFASHSRWIGYKNSGQRFKAKTNILLAAEPGRGISGSKSFTQAEKIQNKQTF